MQPRGQPCPVTRPDPHPLLQIADYIGKTQKNANYTQEYTLGLDNISVERHHLTLADLLWPFKKHVFSVKYERISMISHSVVW